MLREVLLVELHLDVVVLFTQEALEVPINTFGVLHRLKCCTKHGNINRIQEQAYLMILKYTIEIKQI